MSDGRRWRGGSGAREEGEALWKPEMSVGVAVLRAREKKMGSPGLYENPEMEGKEILFQSLAAKRRRQYCEDEEGAPKGGGACKGRCCDDANRDQRSYDIERPSRKRPWSSSGMQRRCRSVNQVGVQLTFLALSDVVHGV
ncbi:hypothetical protein MRB53_028766 [Persea americana]|uniref:Uncharacterized protein n=1 Tax=Persea americana TaxID=3435 RepID=A0ACC2KGX6_PERAE|nr:hypothetical protein MRB53_028766 [Persea americana]